MAAEGKRLVVVVTSVNVKKIDQKAYGITKPLCQVKIKVDDKEVRTTIQPGLDPTWEETFEFPIEDPETTKCTAVFYMDGPEPEKQKQIGEEQQYLLPLLKIGKPVYKGLIVPGGKVDLMMTAYGFGKEDVEEDTGALMDLIGGDEGGMMMDSDEEA